MGLSKQWANTLGWHTSLSLHPQSHLHYRWHLPLPLSHALATIYYLGPTNLNVFCTHCIFHLDTVRTLLGWLIEVSITSPFPQQPGGMGSEYEHHMQATIIFLPEEKEKRKKKLNFSPNLVKLLLQRTVLFVFFYFLPLSPTAVLPPLTTFYFSSF